MAPALLAAEITARTGRDPGEAYRELTRQFGAPCFERIDAAATPAQKKLLSQLTPDKVRSAELAGEKIQSTLTHAPGNHAAIGGLKVIAEHGWFAARPSGTEDVYKIYAESYRDAGHLRQIQEERRASLPPRYRLYEYVSLGGAWPASGPGVISIVWCDAVPADPGVA
jgi:phosphoglucomutase